MFEAISQRQRILLFYAFFVALFFVGLFLSTVGPGFSIPFRTSHQMPSLQTEENDSNGGSVRIISSLAEWQSTVAAGRCILFVDCDWNEAMVAFRKPFSEFADLRRDNTDYRLMSVKLDVESQDELWITVQELWERYDIPPGGLKTFGGAGRVVWLDQGRVKDFAWCTEVFDVSKLGSRSQRAFN